MEWYQQALTPPSVYECNIRIGVVPETDHVQVLVELKDPTTGVLLAQASRPHASMRALAHELAWCTAKAAELLEDEIPPF